MTTGDMLSLRDYQSAAIEAVRAGWARGVRRLAVVMPTGSGKTVVFAHLAAVMHDRGVEKTLILAHRDELIAQAVDKLRVCAPGLRVGVVKASRREIAGNDVIVASVQSLAGQNGAARRAELLAAGVQLIIVDECHHSTAESYMTVLRDLGCFEEDPERGAYAVGVTATLARSDRVALGQVWQEVVSQQDIIDMIRGGYLVNAKGIRVRVDGLDLARVKRSRGDWTDGALGSAMHDALAPAAVARAYVEHAKDRQGIAFWPTVEMAYEGADAFNDAGIVSAGIDGAMHLDDRRDALRAFARGAVRVVHNCAVLTEGYDAPWCSAVVIARPTSSGPLFVQMAGRALRPHPGKRDALILDVVGVTGRHRLASMVDLLGADRVEKLPPDLEGYDDIDLLGLVETGETGGGWDVQRVDGVLTSEIVDLFGTSRQAWLRTARGVWFLSAGERLVFLAPGVDAGSYAVARCDARGGGGEFLRQGVDLSMAMSWGEQFAMEGMKVLVRKGAKWRALEPSAQQLGTARRWGIAVNANPVDSTIRMTRGELSDALSVRMASARLDGMPCVATVSGGGYW